MEWIHRVCNSVDPISHSRKLMTVAVSAFALQCFGCHMTPNPWHDEMQGTAQVETASSRGIREANATPRDLHPTGEPKSVYAVSGTVSHGPLYFEDAYNETGSEDGQFAATREDFHAFWLAGLRFPLNALFWPLHAMVTPPWTFMASDGIPSRHLCCGIADAKPLEKPHG